MARESKNKKKIVITHNGSFHADDVFAVAVLKIFFKGQIRIVRTRDEDLMKEGDILVDVGMKYDGRRNFDHHQATGAGQRSNGIPFASFGLVWKKYGPKICGNASVAKEIDKNLVQSIDAEDNGIEILKPVFDFSPYRVANFILSFNSVWNEDEDQNRLFAEAVKVAEKILLREIKKTKSVLIAKKIVLRTYKNSKNKEIIIFDKYYPWKDFLFDFKKPKFVIFPSSDGRWNISTVKKNRFGFESRVTFPQSWGGLKGEDLEVASGVKGASFCHKKLFLVVAESKESAVELAKKALKSKK